MNFVKCQVGLKPGISSQCLFISTVKMKQIQPRVIKPWVVFILDSEGSRTRIASFSTRGDGETYLFKIRRQLPKTSDPVLAFDG